MVLKTSILLLGALALVVSSQSKIDHNLSRTLSLQGSSNIVISFTSSSKLISQIKHLKFPSRTSKVNHLRSQLELLRSSSQKDVLHLLSNWETPVKYTSLWINNKIYISNATKELVTALASYPEVISIRSQIVATPLAAESGISTLAEWNVDKIQAPHAWALPGGNTGEGVVIGGIDTGVRGSHITLSRNMQPTHNWIDPYDFTWNATDAFGVGTHTMGVAVGAGGIGVAPGAQWMACRGCILACEEGALALCGQFIMCPTLPDGRDEDCSKGAHIVQNGWISASFDADFYDEVIEAWRAAGMFPVFGVGGQGPSCNTIRYPGTHPDVFGVLATDVDDERFGTAGSGPGRNGTIKPNLSAPGVLVRSAWADSDDSYYTLTSNSVSTPHVAGTAALLLSRNPNLDYDEIVKLLGDNAERNLTSVDTCGGSEQWPNNIYGYGRVNARRALEAAINS